jgi:hypothetical protein
MWRYQAISRFYDWSVHAMEIYRPSTLVGIVTQNLVRFLPTLPS